MDWNIYYSDGSSFGSSDGLPWEAPTVDVQIVQQGNDLLFYHDYYLWRKDLEKWVPCNGVDGLLDHLMAFARQIDAVLNGRYMEKNQWEKLLQKVRSNLTLSAGNARQLEQRGVEI